MILHLGGGARQLELLGFNGYYLEQSLIYCSVGGIGWASTHLTFGT